ncbi:Serine protease, subtilisin family [Amycolatopsis xylanica]|uniref:Serine protease, subtilisin family n=1 Tax=Amycolatopsis xylanica TaxID=589385 RepID=A0A1H3NPZ6_9PSEU|nr:S8 family serine peptidase [Amycolatopsis xylanica]SDY90904.1 Serine protease, subtilisin family [Amycolatopsis xylanica]
MTARTALPVILTLAAGILTGGTAAAAPPPPIQADGQSHAVTLLTGDKVIVTDVPGGRHSVRVEPGPGRENQVFFKQAKEDQLVVLPGDVAKQVKSGTLDRALFDVTGLIKQGYDDASRKDLPVIVDGAGLTGASTVRSLPSIHAVAATLPKGGVWTASGQRVRLDRKVKVDLDQSVPQIGAPQAWQAGYTGKGVKVAVLDTGYDHEHPDLKNVVADEKDFTGEGVQDGNGHGTHVASTVAGSGAASNGRYQGAAPDARLLIGKALDNEGSGSFSTIIEAMQWAADAGAKVISMSLGSDTPSDGTDPLSEAVNTISREKGALFVVAAGNEGRDKSIGSPGAADAALTVGSVSKQDIQSSFSSRGPRIGDFAVKPDLTGPGEAIVAARAKGTEAGDHDPVGDFYARLSGTSMATPHVAGAAAILAQEHPQWTGEQLKNALTSTAKVNAGSVYAQGAGRVDVARAAQQKVTASASVGFGLVTWPHDQGKPQVKDVTYTNDGDQPVELTLALTSDAPAGVLSAAQNKLVVPAHGTAKAQVSSRPQALGAATGSFGGRLTATGGGAVLQTAVGISGERESYDLTIKLIDRQGKPQSDDIQSSLALMGDALGPDEGGYLSTAGGQVTVRVPKGKYSVSSLVTTAGPDGSVGDITLVGAPGLTVSNKQTLTLDARPGKKVTVKVPRKSAVNLFRDFGAIVGGSGGTVNNTAYVEPESVGLYAVPATGGTASTFVTAYTAQVTDPLDKDLVTHAPMYNLNYGWPGEVPARIDFTVREEDMARVHATFGNKTGKADLVVRALNGYLPIQTFTAVATTRVHLPGERVEFYTAGDVFWINQLYREPGDGGNPPSPFGAVWATVTKYRPGSFEEPWNFGVEGPGLPGAADGKGIPGDPIWGGRWGDQLSVRAPLFADSGPYQHTWLDPQHVKGGWSVYRDGKLIGSNTQYTAASAEVPPEEATYRFAGFADRAVPWSELSTHVESSWTFRSAHVAGEDPGRLPLIAVKAKPSLDPYNRVPATPMTVLPLRVERQQGAPARPLKSVKAEVSFDDGKTWASAPVMGLCAFVANPANAHGFVSLRVSASDTAGSAFESTVIRAYRLGAP